MTQQYRGLAARYRMRAWCAGFTGTMMVANLALALAPAGAQGDTTDKTAPVKTDKTTPAKPQTGTKTTAKPTNKSTDKKSATKSAQAVTPAKPDAGVKITPAGRGAQIAPPTPGVIPGTPGATPGTIPGAPGTPTPGAPGATPGAPRVPGGFNPGGFNPGGFPQGGFPQGGAGRGDQGATTFTFNFYNSDIDNVLKFFSTTSGLTITKDPALTGPVTVINPKSVTLDEAFRILQSVLYVRGFTAIQQTSGVLAILPFKGAKGTTPLLNSSINMEGPTKVDSRNQFMTQVIPVENADADQLARELKELATPDASIIGSSSTNSIIVTDLASNVSRFISLVEALDKTTTNQSLMKIYSLQRADATAITQLINDLYSKISTRGKGGGGQAQPVQPGFNPQQAQQGGSGASRPAVVAVADPNTNSVIVVASPDNQEHIAHDIIGRLDGDDSNRLDTITRKINFSDAQTVADLVNSVLSNQRPGQGSSVSPSFQSRTFGGGGGGFAALFGGGGGNSATSSTDPFGKIVADPRTNTLLITANKDRMVKIMDLIDKLDVEVPVESTTFVFNLKNAQAQDVSYALGQAFGTGTNTNSGFNNNNNGNRTGTTSNGLQGLSSNSGSRRQGASTGTFGRGTRNSVPPGPPPAPSQSNFADDPNATSNGGSAYPQGVSGVMTDQGFVPTEATSDPNSLSPRTRQIFGGFGGFGGGGFGGGGGGGGRQQRLGGSTSPQYGIGRNGGYSNLLQLQGNVFVTPTPNGDAVLVTTLPANYDAVRQVIEALDIIPRQVMIEVIVAEVTLADDQQLGFSASGNISKLFNLSNTGQVQVNAQSGTNGTSLNTAAQGAQFLVSGTNYSALLQALTTDNKTKVLATPKVFASNNQEASILIAQQVPYGVSTVSGVSNFVTTTPTFAQIGLQLIVTPRITRQGLVTIDLQQEADDLLRFQTIGSGIGAQTVPVINQRVTNTEVTIQDGQTVVIGGLIRNNTGLNITKIPVLSDIPLIGQFFRSHEKTHDRTELMIFMTPHVVNTVEEAHELTLKTSAPVLKQIPALQDMAPNLKLPKMPKGTDTSKLPKDSAGDPIYLGPAPGTTGGTTTPATDNGNGNGGFGTSKATPKAPDTKKPAPPKKSETKPADKPAETPTTANPATSGTP